MMRQRFGQLNVFARAIRENPDAPDVQAYLSTLDLSEREINEVIERFTVFCDLIKRSEQNKLPEIVLRPTQQQS